VTRIAVIGPGTAEALARYGVAPDLVPERFIGESLVESFSRLGGSGRVTLARAAGARPVVPEGLRRLGFDVEEVEAYRAVPVAADERRRAEARQAEAITFTSSSTVHGYLAFNRKDDLPPLVATIGPVTSATARERGIDVGAEASVHTASGLVESLAAWSVVHGRPTRPVAAPS
jgi:uroporphyrinogen-III synthase